MVLSPPTARTSSSGCSRRAAGASTVQPFVDARLPEGSRSTSYPADHRHWASTSASSSGSSERSTSWWPSGVLEARGRAFLDAAVRAGPRSSWPARRRRKDDAVECLASAIPACERIVTCEEVFELRIAGPDVVAMQCRQTNLEGEGARDPAGAGAREPPDATGPHRRRRSARRGDAGHVAGAQQRRRGDDPRVHANSAREALRKLTTLPCWRWRTWTGASSRRPWPPAWTSWCSAVAPMVPGRSPRPSRSPRRWETGTEPTTGNRVRRCGRDAALDRRDARRARALRRTGHRPHGGAPLNVVLALLLGLGVFLVFDACTSPPPRALRCWTGLVGARGAGSPPAGSGASHRLSSTAACLGFGLASAASWWS